MGTETPIAHWSAGGIEYGVCGIDDGGVLVIVIAAVGPGDCERTAHLFRPPNAAELADQVTRWSTSDDQRTLEAERLLSSPDPNSKPATDH
jgi:hypothetical protein